MIDAVQPGGGGGLPQLGGNPPPNEKTPGGHRWTLAARAFKRQMGLASTTYRFFGIPAVSARAPDQKAPTGPQIGRRRPQLFGQRQSNQQTLNARSTPIRKKRPPCSPKPPLSVSGLRRPVGKNFCRGLQRSRTSCPCALGNRALHCHAVRISRRKHYGPSVLLVPSITNDPVGSFAGAAMTSAGLRPWRVASHNDNGPP